MLSNLVTDIRKDYYDPKFHGVDLDAKLNEAKQRIAQAPTYDAATADIAAVFESLNDSHAFFVPPGHSIKQEYGWRYQMIGNRCLVTRVKPRSDAEAKGVKPGDQVLTLEGFEPTRDSIVRLQYALDDLMPMRSLTVDLLDPMRKMREVQLKLHCN